MKSAIVGTRNPSVTYQEWEKLLLDKINPDDVQFGISGSAKSVDTFAKLFACRHSKPYMEFSPQYTLYGRYATLSSQLKLLLTIKSLRLHTDGILMLTIRETFSPKR